MSENRKTVYRARLKNIGISPRKMRLIADLVRGKKVELAFDHLALTNKKGARIFEKLLNSALANAKDQGTVDIDRLKIEEAMVDQGLAMRRFLPRAQGRATPIKKRMSHVKVGLIEV